MRTNVDIFSDTSKIHCKICSVSLSKGALDFTPVNSAVETMVPSDYAALQRTDCCGALVMDLILMWLWLLAFVYLASVAYVNHKSTFELRSPGMKKFMIKKKTS